MKKEISIEKLIKKISFEDIEWIEISKLIKYIQPSKYIVENKNYNVEFKTPVLTPGKSFILGYTNETNGIYNASNNNSIILFDDFTTSFHWVDFDFKVKSSALKILINNDDKISNFKFLYYSMRNIKNEVQDHTRQWISKYSKLKIPLPPIEIQAKIVDILDNFAELTAELTAELLARKEQYHYYRNKLLSFDISGINDSEKENTKRNNLNYYTEPVQWKNLIECSKISRGVRITKNELIKNAEFAVISGGSKEMGRYDKFNRDKNTITIAQYGTAGFIAWQENKFWANDVCYSINAKSNLNQKYLYYFLKSKQNNIYSLLTNAIPQHLPFEKLKNLLIPIPPIEVQIKIVNILDQFNTLCNDILKGLPAEIKMRKEQYEYYRNKLLTF